jgi:peptide/nickel transport system permease protein
VTAVDLDTIGGLFDASPLAAVPRRHTPGVEVLLSTAWLLVVFVFTVAGRHMPGVGDPYAIDPLHAKAAPSWAHLFGTDDLGRDIFTRCVMGARTSFVVTLSALGLALLVGGALGTLVGYYRGLLETVVMTVADVVLAFPGLILLLGVVTFMGQSVRNVSLALALLITPGFIRIIRANTIRYTERLFVLSARTLGAGDLRIIRREILPNILPPIAGIALIFLGVLVLAEGGLSFLGLGVPLPRPTWGGMIASGLPDLETSPLITFLPAAVLFLTVLSFNLLGDALRRHYEIGESRA